MSIYSPMRSIVFCLLLCLPNCPYAQQDTCIAPVQTYQIESQHLGATRQFWISLPLRYDPQKAYPVMYVLDAEWRMDLVRPISYDFGGNELIPQHIVVGIPHIDWRSQRGKDLTFSQSRIEYDGSIVDSTTYNTSNSGQAAFFYKYLTTELIPKVNQLFKTSGQNMLIGHSYGGYFGAYILGRDHPFQTFHIYDPSIWYSDGEVLERIQQELDRNRALTVYLSFQPAPSFHAGKIRKLIQLLESYPNIRLGWSFFPDYSHNALFLPSFWEGIRFTFPKKNTRE